MLILIRPTLLFCFDPSEVVTCISGLRLKQSRTQRENHTSQIPLQVDKMGPVEVWYKPVTTKEGKTDYTVVFLGPAYRGVPFLESKINASGAVLPHP